MATETDCVDSDPLVYKFEKKPMKQAVVNRGCPSALERASSPLLSGLQGCLRSPALPLFSSSN